MATAVTRVLPWRRGALPADEIAPLLAAYRARHPRASTAMISRAYAEATNAHAGQFRASGDAYVTHPLAVAQVVAELGLDDEAGAPLEERFRERTPSEWEAWAAALDLPLAAVRISERA